MSELTEVLSWIEGQNADEAIIIEPDRIRQRAVTLSGAINSLGDNADELIKAQMMLSDAASEMDVLERKLHSLLTAMKQQICIPFAQTVRSKLAPEASAYVDRIEAEFGPAVATTCATYAQVQRTVEQEMVGVIRATCLLTMDLTAHLGSETKESSRSAITTVPPGFSDGYDPMAERVHSLPVEVAAGSQC